MRRLYHLCLWYSANFRREERAFYGGWIKLKTAWEAAGKSAEGR